MGRNQLHTSRTTSNYTTTESGVRQASMFIPDLFKIYSKAIGGSNLNIICAEENVDSWHRIKTRCMDSKTKVRKKGLTIKCKKTESMIIMKREST